MLDMEQSLLPVLAKKKGPNPQVTISFAEVPLSLSVCMIRLYGQ